jgi:multidrug efflux pump
MTSIAFIAGVFPLVVAHGAGAEMRQAMGVAVFAGMIGVTLFGLFLTPVFYLTLMRRVARKPAVISGHEPHGPALGAAERWREFSCSLRCCHPFPRKPGR